MFDFLGSIASLASSIISLITAIILYKLAKR